jgi:hypothetical protein
MGSRRGKLRDLLEMENAEIVKLFLDRGRHARKLLEIVSNAARA